MPELIARNHTGHRVGESHGRSKYSDETVRKARELHDDGIGCDRIGQMLDVPWRTVSDWLNYSTRYSA